MTVELLAPEILDRLGEMDDDQFARLFRALDNEPKPGDEFPTPAHPPIEWFQPRGIQLNEDGSPPKIKVTADGRVEGYFFQWGHCILGSGIDDSCWSPEPSPSGYNLFHQADVAVDHQGETRTIKAGLIVPGHADPTTGMDEGAQIEHYSDPTKGIVVARAYEDEIGGYIVGAIRPGATYAHVALVRASALSGHWNFIARTGSTAPYWDCLGPCLVVRPGLPLDRNQDLITAAVRYQPPAPDAGRAYVVGELTEPATARTAAVTETIEENATMEDITTEEAEPVTPEEGEQVTAAGDGEGGSEGGGGGAASPEDVMASLDALHERVGELAGMLAEAMSMMTAAAASSVEAPTELT